MTGRGVVAGLIPHEGNIPTGREAEIPHQLQVLGESIEELLLNIDKIAERLSPVLSLEAPENPKPDGPPNNLTPQGQTIASHRRQVLRAVEKIQSLYLRIEV